MKVVGFDLETGSAKKLYNWTEPEPFIVLNGWIVDGHTHVSPDPEDLLKVLYDADLIYGHNIYAFDIPALAIHAGADYEKLMSIAVDTRILGQQEHPQNPKTITPAILYNLNDMAARLGVEGKTDSSRRLAEKLANELIDKETEGLVGKEATLARRRAKQKYKDPYDVAHLIPWWDPELIAYLEGDLHSGQETFRKLWHHMNIRYSQDELENYRNLNRMVYLGCRINLETADRKVEEENTKAREALDELREMCPGMPETGESPLASKLGKIAFEEGLLAAGVAPENIPRTPKNGGVSTSRDALSEGDWVVTVPVPYGRYNATTGEKYTEFKYKRERRQGLRQLYPDNPKVQKICKLATTVSGKSRKYAEIRGKALDNGMVHAKIGDIQVSGRVAFIEPSITNVGKRGDGLNQRSLIVPRRQGEVLMCSDLSQGDMRVMAALSQDPEYMALFVGDRDAHTEVALALLGSDEIRARMAAEGNPKLDDIVDKELKALVKDLRQKAKAIGHGVNYGMGVESTIANTGIDRATVEQYFEMRARTYRVLNQWTEKARREARTGWIEDNGFGRRMKCDPLQAHTQGPALYGQSGTREVIMRGIRNMPLEVRQMLVMVVHDEVVLSVPEDRYDEIAAIVQESLRFTWRNVFFDCDVSTPGHTWAECYGLAA